uniref:Protein phosphatase 2 regulatory subunit B'epsilon n=1 Tax=Gallus gallus TaxID=9031 RepID=A0A8V0Z9Y6_CHICK
MSSAPTTPPSVDKVDGFSRKSVRKARQKRSQSSSQFRSQGKPIELTPLPLLKGSQLQWFSLKVMCLTPSLVSAGVYGREGPQ